MQKTKDFLVCVDSDGCAIDTMNIKHIRCFGPSLVEEYNLHAHKDAILARWNDINLYTRTRGINRFKGLAMILNEINAQYTAIEDVQSYIDWVSDAKELSNASLESYIQSHGGIALQKALSWSKRVNASIDLLGDDDKRAFLSVKKSLEAIKDYADVAVVSSANKKAVQEEWDKNELLHCVDVIFTQEDGTKSDCIQKLLQSGYEPTKVLMVGDAVGDLEASEKNGVYFYPIAVNRENESWENFATAFEALQTGKYEDVQKSYVSAFLTALP
ncbi:MAG: HAD hydrolase-like protein [Spirochaetales bacterium]